jgi:DNA-binding SARP family transcriptional activator/TolB-like protein
MPIRLTTLGGLSAHDDGAEMDWVETQRLRAALLVYLAVERTASRAALTALFWPESDEDRARHALRQNLYELRRALGDGCFEARTREIRVTDQIATDLAEFDAAIARGDAAGAAQLYSGPFLAGVYLVDLKPWEVWVEARRVYATRAFRKACREWVEACRTSGDHAGAIAAAQRWISPDPLDDEAQHKLIELLAEAGQRTDAIRQYEAYAGMLAAEGLDPLDETKELWQRLVREPAVASEVREISRPPTFVTPPAVAREPAPPVPAGLRPRRRRVWLWPAVGAAAIGVAALGAHALLSGPDPAVSSTTVAVLPFSVSGGAEYEYLGEGMVDLLSRSLDGAGELRTVDAATVLRRYVESDAGGPLDRARARDLAGRLGAGLYVLGSMHIAGGRLRAHVTLGNRDGTGEPIQTQAEGDTTELFELVDRLTTELLTAQRERPFSAKAIRSAGRTTASLTALKAFLTAEHDLRAARYPAAIEGFERAVSEDSAFALAWYRMALARIWNGRESGNSVLLDRAVAQSEHMTERDRRLLEALVAFVKGSPSEAEQRYRDILQDYPGDLEAKYQLADVLYHHNPLVGRPPAESMWFFERVLAVDPEFLCPI